MTVSNPAPAGRRRAGPRPGRRCRAVTAAAPAPGSPRTPAAPPTPAAPASQRGQRVARGAAAAVVVAALAAVGVSERAAVAASFAMLGHLQWLWIPAAIVLESASMAAFAIMLRRLLAAGAASVGIRPMLATAYAANALSVSVPLAGPELATAFTFRRFTRQGADAPLAGWSWAEADWRRGTSWPRRPAFRAAYSPWPPSSEWPLPRVGRGCAAHSNGPPPGYCGTGSGWPVGPPAIPARPSGPGLPGWARSNFRPRAG